ncbi:MAG: type II secretion system protein [Roseateles sp.]|uniref:type II secretion system protein n=1 Tax=Roseateles sp. TaxID=1971397 RepID=UPI0040372624
MIRVRAGRGYSYLAVLFLVALTAAGLAGLGQAWHTAAQRERERELAFRGGEIARAIASYVRSSPNGAADHPRRLEDLLEDLRGPKALHHLRRLYPDPFTGQADWSLVPEPGQPGSFSGVHSRADRPLLRTVFFDGATISNAREWKFLGRDHGRRERGVKPMPQAPGSVLPALPVVEAPMAPASTVQ